LNKNDAFLAVIHKENEKMHATVVDTGINASTHSGA